MEENKIFSVIIPVYNGEKTIERALASLISNKNWIYEVIIVNDHSNDNTIKLAQQFQEFLPLKFLTSSGNHNPGVARQTGLLAASGQWITFLDADDCLTANCLQYVWKQIQLYENIVLLHSKTIYYELGTLIPENIEYSDGSCGGNFYKRDFLTENNLSFHDKLRMSEDEYFNRKITLFINYCINIDGMIQYYDYPAYEVHHDDGQKSFAHSNWVEYLIKSHLLCQQYLTEFFLQYPQTVKLAKVEFINNFIFCYYLFLYITNDDDLFFDYEEQLNYFRESLQFFTDNVNGTKEELIQYYKQYPYLVEDLKNGASVSTGVTEIEDEKPFRFFIENL